MGAVAAVGRPPLANTNEDVGDGEPGVREFGYGPDEDDEASPAPDASSAGMKTSTSSTSGLGVTSAPGVDGDPPPGVPAPPFVAALVARFTALPMETESRPQRLLPSGKHACAERPAH